MFFLPSVRRHPAFREGWRAMAPVCPGIAAWGLMTGVAMLKSGLSVTEAVAMALLVYAGSSQLASVPLIIAGAPMWVILATAFCVNLRFVVFSLHLRPYLMHLPRWRRLVTGYVTGDMSYVLFTKRYARPGLTRSQLDEQEAYLLGGCAVTWASWIGMSLVGIALANLIPTHWGLGFAGVLSLVGILCSLATDRQRRLALIVAGLTAVAVYSLPMRLNIVVAIGVAVLVGLWLEPFLVRPGAATASDDDDSEPEEPRP